MYGIERWFVRSLVIIELFPVQDPPQIVTMVLTPFDSLPWESIFISSTIESRRLSEKSRACFSSDGNEFIQLDFMQGAARFLGND